MWTQDRAYVDLMRELWGSPSRWNSRRTYLDVASKLGVDEETVRNRLKRLKESGYLKGWRMLPYPGMLGRESRMIFVDFGDPKLKEEGLVKLQKMDGVVVVASVYGKGAIVTFLDDPAHKVAGLIAGMGIHGSAKDIGGMRFLPTSFRMTPTDWHIVSLMLRDAERDISEVAKEVKVSTRTVRRRLNQMMDASAVAVMPVIDQSKSGGASFTFMVECEEARVAEVERTLSTRIENLGFSAPYSSNGLIIGFIARNASEGSQFQRWAESQRYVKSVMMNLVDEVVYCFDWLERETGKLSASDIGP